MIIFKDTKYREAPFNSEAELEQVIVDNYEYLFGPTSIYLPKAKIKTSDGAGTIPDGFAIDIALKRWYIVEAELIHHNVWSHIAPQVTKQILASKEQITKRILIDLTVSQYENDSYTKEKFDDLKIRAIHVRRIIEDILETDPIVGVPIDGVTNDLTNWAKTLKNTVKLWRVKKYVELNKPNNIAYEFPEEFKPEIDTAAVEESKEGISKITQYDVTLGDLINAKLLNYGEMLYMNYKPKNGTNKKYEALVLEDGSFKLLGQTFNSPSYAALAGIQDAGSDRKTVNGWTSWKNNNNKTLADLREIYLEKAFSKDS
ncbi:hypothetical protein LJC38_03625 [Parabacteroides sp. OttesenSCG-928-K15]|nr:hypothetical protein [Parabacteroides sp. OttesenSCG-928-K15]